MLDKEISSMEAAENLNNSIKIRIDWFIIKSFISFSILIIHIYRNKILSIWELIHEIHKCFVICLLEHHVIIEWINNEIVASFFQAQKCLSKLYWVSRIFNRFSSFFFRWLVLSSNKFFIFNYNFSFLHNEFCKFSNDMISRARYTYKYIIHFLQFMNFVIVKHWFASCICIIGKRFSLFLNTLSKDNIGHLLFSFFLQKCIRIFILKF